VRSRNFLANSSNFLFEKPEIIDAISSHIVKKHRQDLRQYPNDTKNIWSETISHPELVSVS
jgi:hypothetical protein